MKPQAKRRKRKPNILSHSSVEGLAVNTVLHRQRNELLRAAMEALQELIKIPPSDNAEHPTNVAIEKLQAAIQYVKGKD